MNTIYDHYLFFATNFVVLRPGMDKLYKVAGRS